MVVYEIIKDFGINLRPRLGHFADRRRLGTRVDCNIIEGSKLTCRCVDAGGRLLNHLFEDIFGSASKIDHQALCLPKED